LIGSEHDCVNRDPRESVMSQRLKFIVAYDGTLFAGWQSQTHGNTIQDHLECAFQQISRQRLKVHGSGRTDAGVHALAQCAHVDLVKGRLSLPRWTAALNALLPPVIRVLRCQYVSPQFHARFSAKGKVYRYRIWSGPVLPPLEYKRAWHITARLDFERLKRAANEFVGTHNFAAFAATREKKRSITAVRRKEKFDTIRTIQSIRVRRNGPRITIEIDGNGFLYKMVRLMIGAAVECALDKFPVEQIRSRLKTGRGGPTRFAAPAEGLFLVRVRY
jgi:tRNA pseudouridine38-40 synthase